MTMMRSAGLVQHPPDARVSTTLCETDIPQRPPLVLVDGSNTAYGGDGCPKLSRILAIQEELDSLGLRSITIVDASLRHRIDDPVALEKMIRAERIFQAPAGRQADEFLLQLGRKRQHDGHPVFILTNDRFLEGDGGQVIPRIAFLLIPMDDSQLVVFSPPLESILAISRVDRVGAGEP